jgi:hypothetical protein
MTLTDSESLEKVMKSRNLPLLYLFLAAAAMLLQACAMQPEAREVTNIWVDADGAAAAPAMAYEQAPSPIRNLESFDSSEPGSAPLQRQERLIIRTGELRVVVADTEESVQAITRLVSSLEGWVVSSSLHQRGDAKAGTMTIRVPAAQFDTALDQIKALAVSVTSENSSGQDVTEEYVDLAARLGNLEATAARVRTFLDQATTVEEALNVNRELSRLESEIEAMKGRIQFLEQSAAFSTLTIHLTPDALAQPFQIGGWRPEGTAREAIQSLISALQSLADVAIWLALYLLPLAAVTVAPVWLGIRFLVRLWRGRGAKAATAQPGD